MNDIKGIEIQIGDIVKIENSPIKSDNATYVVGQDGTSKGYSGKDLTLYKVAKHKGGYSLSRSSYNICFYPLHNYSNKYSYTREEMNAATIEILLKADSSKFKLVKSDDKYENEETEQTYFRAVVKIGDKEIEDISYPISEEEKITAFFSNITLKNDEIIEICKQDHTWGYYYRNIDYKLESIKIAEETTEEVKTDNYTYEVTEDTDTRDNSIIFVVKAKEKLNRDEYIKVNEYMKSIGGYYSRFKHGFIFKENLSSLLNTKNIEQSDNVRDSQTTTEEPQEQHKKSIEYEILEDKHIKTNDNVWIVKVKSTLSKDDFAEIKRKFATLKGFYSSLNNSFIFKYDPTEKIKQTA